MSELLSVAALLAQEGPASAPNPFVQMVPILLIFAILYLLLIRPQAKREKERQAMLSAVDKNDRVVTQGGLHAVVHQVKDDELVVKLEPDRNVKVRLSRSAVSAVLGKAADDKGDDKPGKKDKGKGKGKGQ